MEARDASSFDALAAKVSELGQICARLSEENAELRHQVSRMSAGTTSAAEPAGISAGRAARTFPVGGPTRPVAGTISRRMVGKAMGAAAVGAVGAAALVDLAQPAAASDGSAITAGAVTTAEHGTTLKYDSASNLAGVVFLANDTGFVNSNASFPAALGGWAGGHVANGIYGYTEVNGGNAIVGVGAGGANSVGVKGTNGDGTAVAGTSGSTASSATAIVGTISSTSPGGFSAGVRGVNNGTGGLGIGVWGSQAGSGWGVYGSVASGIGVNAEGGTGTGVSGSGSTGVAAFGSTTGVNASGPTAVLANGQGAAGQGLKATNNSAGNAAVKAANAGTGAGIHATSSGGRGGIFGGAPAQIQLAPGSRSTHPTSGLRGDLYADKTGRLWFCKKGGAHATWHQVA